ncbi:MAG TPA: S26 family signal peptidase [Catenuloplanes sp.]
MSWSSPVCAVGGTLAAAAALVALARSRLAVVTVTGSSMTPTYRDGDRVLVLRTRRLRRGSVVVAGSPTAAGSPTLPGAPAGDPLDGRHRLLIKRIGALPGDVVPAPVRAAVAAHERDVVPDGRVVLIGDGPHSTDSRTMGYFRSSDVHAVVVAVLGSTPLRGEPASMQPRVGPGEGTPTGTTPRRPSWPCSPGTPTR